VFSPIKNAWRYQLCGKQDQDSEAKLLQKTEFPAMLSQLLPTVNTKRILPSAFRKCKLCPLIRMAALDRIPSELQTHEIAEHVDAALLKRLEVRRV